MYKYKHIFKFKISRWYKWITCIELDTKNSTGFVNALLKSVVNSYSLANVFNDIKLLTKYFMPTFIY